MTPQERKERARIAANERWARPGARQHQSKVVAAAVRRRREDQVDPDRVMGEATLNKAVTNAVKAEMARLRRQRKTA